MTQDEKRIKLAEAGGWKVHPKDQFIVIPPNSPHSVQPLSTIPDYFSDLNAVHEAVTAQSGEFLIRFRNELADLCGAQHYHNATAAQRAEALGLTLNLWEQ